MATKNEKAAAAAAVDDPADPAGPAATDGKPSESPPPPVNADSGTAAADPQASAPAAPAPDASAPAAGPAASDDAAIAAAAASKKQEDDAKAEQELAEQAERDRLAAEQTVTLDTAAAEPAKRVGMLDKLEAEAKAHTARGEHSASTAIQGLHAKFVDILQHVKTALAQEEVKLEGEARALFEDMKRFL